MVVAYKQLLYSYSLLLMFSSFNRSALVAFALAAASGLASDLSIKVSGPSTVASVDDFVVKTSLTNFGDREITLLNDPNSILTPDWKTATFGVINADGAPAKFGGVKVRFRLHIGRKAL